MDGILQSLSNVVSAHLAHGSVLAIGAAFLLGVFVGFTPCMYPVLPITVAYIGSIARGRRLDGLFYSSIYVLGMALVYATIGIVVAVAGGVVGGLWNNGWVLLALANLFLVLALWQLGVVHIPVPQFVRGSESRRGGIWGALGVGAASGLVVGPCTLPGLTAVITLIGSSVRSGSAGSLVFGAAAMFAYSLGLGSLIIVCGTFSGFLANLPRSGQWLNVIEKAFAVLMILAAEFFLIYLGQNANFPLLSSLVGSGG
jgi:thiol:disulfide interchange protein DsbD